VARSEPNEESPGGGRATERAYTHIRSGILNGDLAPGARLAEKDVASTLGISRTPVRQALRRLLQEDLVEVGYRRQITVRGVSPETRREVFMIREALERVAVTEACRVMPIEEIDYLRLLLMRQQRAADAGDSREIIDLDDEFHQRIAAGGRLPTVAKFLSHLRAFVRLMGIEAIAQPGRIGAVISEHERVVDALESRDAEVAVEAMLEHIRHTAAAIEGTREAPATKRRAVKKAPSGATRDKKRVAGAKGAA
jgi:DNA-binding GntR family transcriptional regulator